MSRKFKIYDLVKIKKINNGEQMKYIGAEGMIMGVEDYSYTYDVFFFNKQLQVESIRSGGYLWKEYQLEGI